MVALDVRDGQVRTSGWTEGAGLSLDDAIARCLAAGVTRVHCTAIDRDGTLAGPDLELVRRVAASGLRVVAAAGVRSPADVAALADAGRRGRGRRTRAARLDQRRDALRNASMPFASARASRCR